MIAPSQTHHPDAHRDALAHDLAETRVKRNAPVIRAVAGGVIIAAVVLGGAQVLAPEVARGDPLWWGYAAGYLLMGVAGAVYTAAARWAPPAGTRGADRRQLAFLALLAPALSLLYAVDVTRSGDQAALVLGLVALHIAYRPSPRGIAVITALSAVVSVVWPLGQPHYVDLAVQGLVYTAITTVVSLQNERTFVELTEAQWLLRNDAARLYEAAIRDPLTQLYNRRYAAEFMKNLVASDRRTGQTAAIVVVDIDHLKRINDELGHGVGDRVLELFGELLQERVRDSDVAARVDGEEFLLILPNSGPDGAYRVAERVRTAIAHMPITQVPWPITASLGVCTREKGDTVDTWLVRADERLYEAKRTGRNRVVA